ncbi:unnamed protein product [Rotaria sordida]|uniref:Uncharacterized protein n=1 Tax=Rotaria sordida TaxID=392033 RepID=A0A819KTX9_9BILA|nr:unnamed protein product [Rotaria sordida]CAF3951702.1 unnamed protein product [Rotaria sordida]
MPLSPSFRALLDNLRPEQEQSTGRIAREDVELNEVTTNNETMAVQNSTINNIHENNSNNSTSHSNITNVNRLYPLKTMVGKAAEHNRSSAEYGHLSAEEIAKKCKFDLRGIPTASNRVKKDTRMKIQALTICCNTRKFI